MLLPYVKLTLKFSAFIVLQNIQNTHTIDVVYTLNVYGLQL